MALAITLKAGERITINDAQVVVDSRVMIRVMNDSQIELPDRGKTIARKSLLDDQPVMRGAAYGLFAPDAAPLTAAQLPDTEVLP